jgi:hypothetical protein
MNETGPENHFNYSVSTLTSDNDVKVVLNLKLKNKYLVINNTRLLQNYQVLMLHQTI